MAEAPKTRELNYLMVQNMGYDAETRTLRHQRAGGRKCRVMLDTGRRIRDKGERFDEVTFTDVLANFNMLLQGIQVGSLRVCRPDNLEPLTAIQFLDLGKRLAADFRHDLKVDETLLEPLVGSDLTDKQVWVEKPRAAQPPIDNEHVAPGAEQFSPETIAANAKTELPAPAATPELSAPPAPAKPAESQPVPEATPAPALESPPAPAPAPAPAPDTNPKHPGKKGRR